MSGKNPDRTGECPECHRLRHRKGCSSYIGHTHTKMQAAPAKAATKRTPITRRRPLPKRKLATSLNGQPGDGLLSELDALRSTAAALEPLTPEQRTHVLACVCGLLAVEIVDLSA